MKHICSVRSLLIIFFFFNNVELIMVTFERCLEL
jgi:hypothetical protein